ncbi:transaldolase [Chloroflexi bacterium TSY]|nr:transaldolase [Chloroflexi bacterium TSY]
MNSSSTSTLYALNNAGQSIWLDFIERDMVQSGKLASLVRDGVTGVTSNPSIFQQAITTSDAYFADLQSLMPGNLNAKGIFETLAISDIQAAADVLRSVYNETNKQDGYVSIEVAPDLAYDTEATIVEARRLWQSVDRPNLMVKVPATKEGIPAIRELIGEGININVTLIFGLERYAEVKDAYLRGLEQRVDSGQPVEQIASVASFFISRVDSNIDDQLNELMTKNPANKVALQPLMGKAAIANAKLAYAQFQDVFGINTPNQRWQPLADAGAQLQRPLWASTSTKNPDYSDALYVDTLIGPHTVNTMPPATLDAFKDHGTVARTIDADLPAADKVMQDLADAGISMLEVTEILEDEGVQKFADSYQQLLNAIEERQKELVATV